MKRLRMIRIIVSLLFFAASIAYVIFGAPNILAISKELQITTSLLSINIGVILFWCATTLLFGRIYCSSVCPLGTLQDFVIRLSRKHLSKRSFRYRHPRNYRYDVVIIYIVGSLLGVGIVSLLLEPWQIFRNIIDIWHPSDSEAAALHLGIGITIGLICGIASFLLILSLSFFRGRIWCTDVCPIGIMLGAISSRSLLHIEIDPDKCINCMACEEGCKSGCIKVVSRYVDNTRCIRCFNCIASCPNDAIRYQPNRNKASTPLMRRVKNTT